jgi:hypothetical protein
MEPSTAGVAATTPADSARVTTLRAASVRPRITTSYSRAVSGVSTACTVGSSVLADWAVFACAAPDLPRLATVPIAKATARTTTRMMTKRYCGLSRILPFPRAAMGSRPLLARSRTPRPAVGL